MDDRFTPRPVAGWYMVGAIGSLLFMALGCLALAMHVMADPSALPLDQREVFEAEPHWVLAASSFAFVAGLIGSILLFLKRHAAERVLLISLVGMVLWFGGVFATPPFRDLLSTGQIALLVVTLALTWTIYWFARHSRQRGGLR